MRHYLFLHYGWFFQNLRKEAVRTFMHTTVVASIVASSCVGENANVLRMHFPLHLHTRKTNMMRFQFYALKWPSVYRKHAI